MANTPAIKIDVESLAKAMCIADGHDPSALHNGYDPMWRLYFTPACRVANVYNELFLPREDTTN